MHWELLAFNQKMPEWVQQGLSVYIKRFTSPYKFSITELPLLKRPKSGDLSQIFKKEQAAMLNGIKANTYVIALEVTGKQFDSFQMAERLNFLEQQTSHIQFLIGGPEGLHPECLAKANEKWSLSDLTLAHPLVRLFMAETLYRCWAINKNHPYHK